MSHILFMRLAGPMQSWGTMSRFTRRDTGKEPSKSGVIGLICAAMGIDRDAADIDLTPEFAELANSRFGIRVLREGEIQTDFHTALEVVTAEGKTAPRPRHPDFTVLSYRKYLSDADFIAAFGSDDRGLLERVQASLKKPVWQVFLGRKAFVPSLPVFLPDDVAIVESGNGLAAELGAADLLDRLGVTTRHKPFDDPQRLIVESEYGSEIRSDVPVSFADRRFTIRRVATSFIPIKGGEKNGTLSQPVVS